IDSTGKSDRIGAAVALDDDAVEADEDAAVHGSRVELLAQCRKGAAGEKIAEPRHQGPRHGVAKVLSDLPGRPLGRLQRNVAAEPLGDDDIHGSLADVVAL